MTEIKDNSREMVEFKISFLIRITLMGLYFALIIPLPFLADFNRVNVPNWILWLGIVIGALAIFGVLSERLVLDNDKIEVCYPSWINWLLPRGWSLRWSEIKELKMRTTGQGGLVYYFITKEQDRAYLLPMRIAGFARMLRIVGAKTGIDTTDIRPLSQPWMYLILLVFTCFLLLIDTWTIASAINFAS